MKKDAFGVGFLAGIIITVVALFILFLQDLQTAKGYCNSIASKIEVCRPHGASGASKDLKPLCICSLKNPSWEKSFKEIK